MTSTAKVFMSGNSQAIRLPSAFRFKSRVVKISQTSQGLLIADEDDHRQRTKAFAKLQGSCADFPEVEANLTPGLPRDLE